MPIHSDPHALPRQRAALREALEAELARRDAAGLTGAQRIARALVALAERGNVQAAAWVADRTEGRPPQHLQVDGRATVNIVPWLPATPEAYARLQGQGRADEPSGTTRDALAVRTSFGHGHDQDVDEDARGGAAG
jgi:hypothetical protein